jgi:hypothetical protein
MYSLLDLYAQPLNPEEPVVCLDEKSKQLLGNTRAPLPLKPGADAKEDYEYKRAGTRNIFVAVEPKGAHREASVTARRTKADFVAFVLYLLHSMTCGCWRGCRSPKPRRRPITWRPENRAADFPSKRPGRRCVPARLILPKQRTDGGRIPTILITDYFYIICHHAIARIRPFGTGSS